MVTSDAGQDGHWVETSVLQHMLHTLCCPQTENNQEQRKHVCWAGHVHLEDCEKSFVSVQIMKTPQALSYHGVGPMVSARVHDLDILWARTFQLFDLCTKVGMLHILDFSTVQHHSMYIGVDMMITTRTSQIVRRTSANGQQITNAQTSLLAC